MKEYYDRDSKQPVFEVDQRVWVYSPRTRKALSKKLLYKWFGPYRIVEQSSPVHYCLRTETNKKVAFAVHANRMKPFFDPALRPVEPPPHDDPNEPYLDEVDIPEDSFEKDQPADANVNTGEISQDSTASHWLESQTNSQNAQLQSDTNQDLIDNQTVFNAEKILLRIFS